MSYKVDDFKSGIFSWDFRRQSNVYSSEDNVEFQEIEEENANLFYKVL